MRWPLRWRSFFYTTDILDIGIDSVVTRTSEGQKFATIALHRFTSVPFPVRLRVGYACRQHDAGLFTAGEYLGTRESL
ncbi:MAG: hypothetical protein AUI63_06015 [Gemmatimonadetes bacterium 13_1_40CM_2_60_3]|nr:MAG: hypothetical protein AUI63_06015 [Gemmatimonadetes bacterium 13_1_40CM_2_60_3]